MFVVPSSIAMMGTGRAQAYQPTPHIVAIYSNKTVKHSTQLAVQWVFTVELYFYKILSS